MKQKSRVFIQTWVPLLVLGALLFYGLISLPPVSETSPTFHVAFRYLDRGAGETALPSPFLAALLDYRSFDLMLLSLLGVVVTLIAVLFCVVEDIKVKLLDRLLVLITLLSSFLLMGMGWMGVQKGSNWMDYEGWMSFGITARNQAAWAALILVVITLTASLIEGWRIWSLGKEKRHGHR